MRSSGLPASRATSSATFHSLQAAVACGKTSYAHREKERRRFVQKKEKDGPGLGAGKWYVFLIPIVEKAPIWGPKNGDHFVCRGFAHGSQFFVAAKTCFLCARRLSEGSDLGCGAGLGKSCRGGILRFPSWGILWLRAHCIWREKGGGVLVRMAVFPFSAFVRTVSMGRTSCSEALPNARFQSRFQRATHL